jgi:hypothetical protein
MLSHLQKEQNALFDGQNKPVLPVSDALIDCLCDVFSITIK